MLAQFSTVRITKARSCAFWSVISLYIVIQVTLGNARCIIVMILTFTCTLRLTFVSLYFFKNLNLLQRSLKKYFCSQNDWTLFLSYSVSGIYLNLASLVQYKRLNCEGPNTGSSFFYRNNNQEIRFNLRHVLLSKRRYL